MSETSRLAEHIEEEKPGFYIIRGDRYLTQAGQYRELLEEIKRINTTSSHVHVYDLIRSWIIRRGKDSASVP